MRHAADYFVDGPVAARHYNQIGAARNVRSCQGARGGRPGGGRNGDGMSVLPQNFDGRAQPGIARPHELPGTWIVNKDGVPELGYGVFSGFLVKL